MSKGKIQAVIFDWAGTLIDPGSKAPIEAFVELFRQAGVAVTEEEARKPMGLAKRDHLAAMLASPVVAQAWTGSLGRASDESDLDRLYRRFPKIQIEAIRRRAELIPGALETVAALREQGIRIGTTTGYSRELMDVLEPLAADLGLEVDCVVCADQVSAGRPAPWMLFEAAERLGVYPASSIVNVDDTVPGIQAGRNAGMYSIGVSASGATDAAALAAAEAHAVLDSVADLPAWLEA